MKQTDGLETAMGDSAGERTGDAAANEWSAQSSRRPPSNQRLPANDGDGGPSAFLIESRIDVD